MYHKEMQTVKQIQTEILELKNTVENLNSRMNDSEERILELEDNQFKNTQLFRHMGENMIKTKTLSKK